jgi:hypothetical protein
MQGNRRFWMEVNNTPKQWWERHSLHLLLIALSVVPLLYPTTPPLIDLPGHMGRYAVEMRYGQVPALRQFYSFQWQLIGNLGVDILIIPMAKIFGLELGAKLIVILTAALTASGILWIAREVHSRVTPFAFFALPLVYGHPFLFGFINYCFALALALNAFALWLRLERLERFRVRAALFLLIAPVIWLSHAYGWGVLCLLCGSAELIHRHDKSNNWLRACVQTAIDCLPLVPPLILMVMWRTQAHVGGQTGGWFVWRAKWVYLEMTLRDRWRDFDIYSLIFVLVIIALCAALGAYAKLSGGRRLITYSRNLVLSSMILLTAFIFLPRSVYGSAYADMRMIPYVLIIALCGIRTWPGLGLHWKHGIAVAGLLFFAVRTAGTTWSFVQSQEVYAHALGALDYVPEGARLVSFVGHPCQAHWVTNRLEHVPGLAIVRRNAFSNDQWEMQGAQTMHNGYPLKFIPGMGREERLVSRYGYDASQIVTQFLCKGEGWWTLDTSLIYLPRDKFDYVWLLDPPEFNHDNLAGLRLVWKDGKNMLLQVDHSQHPFSRVNRGK